jgi:hypothetical protein
LFREIDDLKARVAPGGDLAALWEPAGANGMGLPHRNNDALAMRTLHDAAAEAWKREQSRTSAHAGEFDQTRLGGILLRQWEDGAGPPPPWARIAISLGQVALEYAQVNPSILGLGSGGEKLVQALAPEIATLLPDVDNPDDWEDKDWNRYYFAERTLRTLFRAGLATINKHPELVFSETHLRALVGNTTTPLVTFFERNDGAKLQWITLQETLLGPVANAALATLAEHQKAFLGDRFAANTAVGAVTANVLDVVRDRGLQDLLGDDLVTDLAAAVLKVAASRPELFLGQDKAADQALARAAFANVAGAVEALIKDPAVKLDDQLVGAIGVAVLDAVASHGPALFDRAKPWNAVAADTVKFVAEGLSSGIKADGRLIFDDVMSRENAVEIVRIVLAQAARTPGMITGDETRAEVKTLLSAIAAAMAADRKMLMGPGDWRKIAAIAAAEAARNPNRLFKIGTIAPVDQLGARIIKSILEAAAVGFGDGSARGDSVSFGEVLVDAVETTYIAAAGNVDAAMKAVGLIPGDGQASDNLGALVTTIDTFAAANPGRVGWREWRWLFGHLVVDMIDEGPAFTVTDQRLTEILQEER